MTKIAFRAWFKPEKRMVFVNSIEFGGNGAETISFDDGDETRIEAVNLMQFTGLLDKQGKEIYEGDILKDVDSKSRYVEVVWNKTRACFNFSRNGFVYEINDGKNNTQYFEVIGNVLENPELLDVVQSAMLK